MKLSVSFAAAALLACSASLVLADEANHGASGNREQMREKCRDNPQECRERMKQHAEEWFKKVDKDGDGSISRDEAKANAPRLSEHFDAVDANHDGKVTFEELRAHHQHMREQHRAEHSGQDAQKKQQ